MRNSERDRRFEGIYRFHLQNGTVKEVRNSEKLQSVTSLLNTSCKIFSLITLLLLLPVTDARILLSERGSLDASTFEHFAPRHVT
jgi:hypothetical protein